MSFSINQLNYKLENIILWGFSLGSAPTVEIASRFQNLGGIVLQSPLASINIWLDKNADYNYQFKENDMFCNFCKIENVKCKIFLLHGKNDDIIDIRHSYILYEKYSKSMKENNQIWFVISHNSGHNDLQALINDVNSTIYLRIKTFLQICKIKKNSNSDFFDEYDKIREIKKKNFLEKEMESLNLTFNSINFNENFLIRDGSNFNLNYDSDIKLDNRTCSYFVDRVNINENYFIKGENI